MVEPVRFTITATPGQLSRVRHTIRQALSALPSGVADDVVLAVHETAVALLALTAEQTSPIEGTLKLQASGVEVELLAPYLDLTAVWAWDGDPTMMSLPARRLSLARQVVGEFEVHRVQGGVRLVLRCRLPSAARRAARTGPRGTGAAAARGARRRGQPWELRHGR